MTQTCDPFKVRGPTCVSLSGGRTSAYMLWRVLQSNGGLPEDAIVCFANTGKEDDATLRFVRDCGLQWSIPIAWLEYTRKADDPRFQVVDYDSAARHGEPFERAINDHNMLPNPIARYCTKELKIRTIDRYIRAARGWTSGEYEMMIGIRADESRRVAKIRESNGRDGDRSTPLATAGATARDVGDFWRAQPFDLQLPNMNGKTMHGNCDLCFLKPASQVLALISENPARAVWWVQQESRATRQATDTGHAAKHGTPSRFRDDRPSYAQMLQYAQQQRDMFDPDAEAIGCFCGD
jgi:3'-phosphoadenosine 5'-phosphosulfate sulfotransferase (PAPS reductase)/FAD synthetase